VARDLEARIEQFAQRLESVLGGNLASLMLYGSAARDHHAGDRSDINLLLIVRDASTRALHGAAPVLAEWSKGGETPPLIFSEEEWRASADVFPVEIEDMRDAHRIIRGRDPLAGITTGRSQLRQQLEREVRGKLLHLRTEYASVAGDAKALGRLLENSLSTFLVLFRATLRLKGSKPPADAASVVGETAKAAGFAPVPFEWALAARSGKAPSALKAFDPLAGQYLDAVEQLAKFVNGL
jgi:hypothetical protein